MRTLFGKCANGIRHWFTNYGAVGEKRANCGHCRQPHPVILQALEAGLHFTERYAAATAKERRRQMADIMRMHEAIERIRNEEAAAHRRR